MSGGGDINVNAYFEPANSVTVEFTNEGTKKVQFGKEARITAISVSHGNDEYVIVSLKKEEDTQPFWSAKFYKSLNGQVFIQPIPKNPIRVVEVIVEAKSGTTITDSVIVNLSYI